ncbi:MAG: CocE/NonD family hydrolase [Bryobacterales bacterium]|nr:CocE/NonD family hydrolase [Bryobacterales bacterium]
MRGLAVICAVTALSATAAGQSPPSLVANFNVRIPMRDGVRLSANVFRPAGPARRPALLVRTPYGKGDALTPNHRAFAESGYAVVVQDVRGRYASEGVFAPLTQEPRDGDDTLNWIARQPWCDGKIGMMGGSYLGIVQWAAAALNNPHLKAIFPVVSGYDEYRDRYYSPGGAMKLGNRLLWIAENLRAPGYKPPEFSVFVRALPLRKADTAAAGQPVAIFQNALDHPAFDGYWRGISTKERLASIRVPVFSVGGWYDNFVESDLAAFAELRKSSKVHRILIGPWPHNMSLRFDGVDFGPDSLAPIRKLQLEWFDQWLKGRDSPLLSTPPVRVFVMGGNRWRDIDSWPPASAKTKAFYLAGKGTLRDRPAGAGSGPDHYLYDPRDPVPTHGGAVCCNPSVFPWGPKDQRVIERRKDVLVYSTEPLKEDTEVTGPVRLLLYAATTAPDTDFTVKLVDVFPDGMARNLTDGILRLRYARGIEREALNKPGEVRRIEIDGGVTSNVFKKGHRIRIEVSSSNFPRFDRNPNTGRPIASETGFQTAYQTIYHDSRRPSKLLLPVMRD